MALGVTFEWEEMMDKQKEKHMIGPFVFVRGLYGLGPLET
jgi:hypothetical protein